MTRTITFGLYSTAHSTNGWPNKEVFISAALIQTNDCCSACTGIEVTVTTTTGPTNFFIVDTIAALRSLASPTTTDAQASVKGDAVAFDNGGGFYQWVSNITTADDGINFIKPNDRAVGEQGRWRKQV